MSSPKTNLLQGIDTVIVRVKSIETSKSWYQEKLGLSSLFEDQTTRLVVLDTGSVVSLTLWQTDQPISVNPQTASYPIFKTPDAQALRQELSGRGIQTEALIQDENVKYFLFYDPDGNVLEACQVHD